MSLLISSSLFATVSDLSIDRCLSITQIKVVVFLAVEKVSIKLTY